jgi:hypothetical protein
MKLHTSAAGLKSGQFDQKRNSEKANIEGSLFQPCEVSYKRFYDPIKS